MEKTGDIDIDAVHYCERFLELLIDLEALLPTRRFFNVVMDDCHLVTRCHLSGLNQRTEGKLFSQVSVFSCSLFVRDTWGNARKVNVDIEFRAK